MKKEKKILAVSGIASAVLIILAIYISSEAAALSGNLIFLSVLVLMVPYSLYKFFEFRRIRAFEEEFPAFLRDLAESQRAGLTVIQAIQLSARSDYGPLTAVIKKMNDQLSWNVPLTDVLKSFGKKMGKSKIILRSLMIIEQANKSGGNIEDTMDSLASNIESIKEVQDEKKTLMNQQVVMMYAIYFIFMGISIALIQFLIPMLQTEVETTPSTLPIMSGGFSANPCYPCIEGTDPSCFSCDIFFAISSSFGFGEKEEPSSYYKSLFFGMIVIQGLFSGLIAGQIGSDSLIAGIKHSMIMLLVGVFSFLIVVRIGII